jgi:hypothetical protein
MANTSFHLTWHAFGRPKHGHSPEEYEDAFAGDPESGRFAVADGASESAFAGSWARILVKAYVKVPGSWSNWLPAARKRWRTKVDGQNLSWYAETKFQEGAQATLLSVAFTDAGWHAQAIGDSCLFHVRNNDLVRSFPISRSADFTNQPALLCSRPRGTTKLKSKRPNIKGDWQPHDSLFLMTDALAQWFLRKVEDGKKPWQELREIGSNEDFGRWVDKQRQTGLMRNDDVTVVWIGDKS